MSTTVGSYDQKLFFLYYSPLEMLHVVQFCRCKHHTEFATPPNRVNSVACGKCNNTQLVAYRAVLAHPYSSTFGYLDLEGCTAFDVNLQKSVFSITCMQCNKSSTVKVFTLPETLLRFKQNFCNFTLLKLQKHHLKISLIPYEPPRGKTNNVVSEQV